METTTHNPLLKLRTSLFNSFIAVLLVFTLQACGDDDNGPTDPLNETGNIAEVAQSDDNFSDLVSALSDAGLVSTLEGDGPFTVFAPTNEAFGNLPDGLLSGLTNEQLTEILSYHVIAGSEIASGDLQSEQAVESFSGGKLFITADGDVVVNDNATVVDADIEASNGTIHAIDQVLLPDSFLDVVGIVTKRYNLQSLEDAVVNAGLAGTLQGDGPFTVFAPTNEAFEAASSTIESLTDAQIAEVLQYHAAAAELLSGNLSDGQTITTVQGEDITVNIDSEGNVTLNGSANVIDVDRDGTNGVVHIIDGVLVPPSFN